MFDVIVWFRRDLRLSDHPTLAWALERNARILPVYIYSPDEESPWSPGGASRWWLHHSLIRLSESLRAHNLKMHFAVGDSEQTLKALCQATGATVVLANRLYEPVLYGRDQWVQKSLNEAGVTVKYFDSNLLFTPGSVLNQQQAPYKVFTPFWRACRAKLDQALPALSSGLDLNESVQSINAPKFSTDVHSLGLLDQAPWHHKLEQYWQPGEETAWRHLESFCDGVIEDYATKRDIPSVSGTSRLSPHLHFGEITPTQILHELMPIWQASRGKRVESIERFVTELGWREFAHHVLWHFPKTSEQSFKPKYSDEFWMEDEVGLRAWLKGETGVPLVDAGMHELWETGWMHNRVRMIVGSFLTKNLGIHWRHGARWFWDTLVDADLANNSMGWQWVAGCGVDAAPYYRIFNPEMQSKKFDPDGTYLDRWLPGLEIHQPIVGLAESRRVALDRYKHWILE